MFSTRLVRLGIAASITVAGVALGAGSASAAHCTDNGGPGHSDFASHVRANAGNNGHDEGAHRGWSTCEENSANYAG